MKKIIGLLLLLHIMHVSSAQNTLPSSNLMRLQLYEDTLRSLGDSIIRSEEEVIRRKCCYDFIRQLVKALQISGSFDYEFNSLCRKDSVQRLAIIYPEDRSFRIFNWILSKDNGTFRYFGAIQLNSAKPLKLNESFFPLFDNSDFIKKESLADTVLTDSTWYGALYYNIITKKSKSKKYYILFGWDGNNVLSNKKVIEVLHFVKKQPRFGAPLFECVSDTPAKTTKLQTRFMIEYKKDASITLNYNTEMKKIIFDHLVSEAGMPDLKYTYIPDGTYEGFEWKKNKWVWIEKIPHLILQDGQYPLPHPKVNDKGNR